MKGTVLFAVLFAHSRLRFRDIDIDAVFFGVQVAHDDTMLYI